MGLANIANIPNVKDPGSVAQWSFSHMANLRDINRVIYETRRFALPEFSLDPLNPNDMAVWLYQHQAMLNNIGVIYGLAAQDLTEVDFADPGQLSSWIFLDFAFHQQASTIAGVS